jgi:hypothetical protein
MIVTTGQRGDKMPNSYNFENELKASEGVAICADVKQILLAQLPSALNAHKAHSHNDRQGTDWWVEMRNGHFISVDCKVRKEDWQLKGKDDLALETWSVVEKQIVGWTRDINKRTDYILWLWKDTGRFVLIPFQMLLAVFIKRWQAWRKAYQCATQHTTRNNGGGYHSECVFVPRRDLWAALYLEFGGANPPNSASV